MCRAVPVSGTVQVSVSSVWCESQHEYDTVYWCALVHLCIVSYRTLVEVPYNLCDITVYIPVPGTILQYVLVRTYYDCFQFKW